MKYLFWLLAIPFYHLIPLIPKKRKRYVFGAWHGEKYADNAKYLMEYLLKEHPSYEVHWMTNNDKLLTDLTNKKIPAANMNSLKGFYLCATAEYIFTCTGPWDINRFAVKNANWVNLWHGSPLKKIGLDRINNKNNKLKNFRETLNAFFFPFNKEHYTFTIAPSRFVEECFSTAFHNRSKSFARLGYPRNDALTGRIVKDQYLYLPTHRGEGDGAINTLFKSLDIKELDQTLEDRKHTLVIKPHFYDLNIIHNTFSSCRNIKVETTKDTYELLNESKYLITDYSSVAFDFAITRRPIIFFAPDLMEYQSRDREFYINYSEITRSTHLTEWNELIKIIKIPDKKHAYIHQRINDLFNEDITGHYSKKLFDYLWSGAANK